MTLNRCAHVQKKNTFKNDYRSQLHHEDFGLGVCVCVLGNNISLSMATYMCKMHRGLALYVWGLHLSYSDRASRRTLPAIYYRLLRDRPQ